MVKIDFRLLVDADEYSQVSVENRWANVLTKSIPEHIRKTVEIGRDRGHGQRQGAEQDLLKQLQKYLGKP